MEMGRVFSGRHEFDSRSDKVVCTFPSPARKVKRNIRRKEKAPATEVSCFACRTLFSFRPCSYNCRCCHGRFYNLLHYAPCFFVFCSFLSIFISYPISDNSALIAAPKPVMAWRCLSTAKKGKKKCPLSELLSVVDSVAARSAPFVRPPAPSPLRTHWL